MSTAKKSIFFGIFFSIAAILFAVLYHFGLISLLDPKLTVIYISYFVGIALFFNGSFANSQQKKVAKGLNFILGFACIVTSLTLLIIGICDGSIDFLQINI